MLALAGAAAVLIAVTGVALTTRPADEVPGDALTSEAPESAVPAADGPAADEPVAGASEIPPEMGAALRQAEEASAGSGQGRGRAAPGERERRIERSAELTLAAPGDELDSVADSIIRVTDRHRGFVLRSSVASGDDSERSGSFDLRIPAESLPAALRDLSTLGHVRARREAGRDVTAAFVSSRDRLAVARAEHRSLLRRLERADTDDQTERLRLRLDAVSLRIERLRREIDDLRERTTYATVTVGLEGTDGGGASGGTGEAFDDSLGLLEGALNLLVRAVGVLLPLAIVVALGWLGGRLLRRRRREAALR